MSKSFLMGNEAIGLGAVRAGVKVVSGYPGTPSTEVLETVAKHNPGDIYVEWSVNEKAGMEVAAAAAYTGARTMVTMKQVGLNVASDPLMSLAYVGVREAWLLWRLTTRDPYLPRQNRIHGGSASFPSCRYLTPVLRKRHTR